MTLFDQTYLMFIYWCLVGLLVTSATAEFEVPGTIPRSGVVLMGVIYYLDMLSSWLMKKIVGKPEREVL